MPTTSCTIWGTPAELCEKTGDHDIIDSPRAGGRYWVSGTAHARLGTLTDHAKLLLTTWLCEQRRAGVEEPKIQDNVLELITARRALSVPERLTAALRTVGQLTVRLGDHVQFVNGNEKDIMRAFAETECRDWKELVQLLRMLIAIGHIEGEQSSSGFKVRPTAHGWMEIDRLSRPQNDSSQAFVAMWFHDSMDDAYFKGIAPALSATGYKPIRIDKKEHNNKIDDEIIAEIRRSRFLIADFTCEPKLVRGGVYYEAGFAQGIEIPVIWTCRNTSIDDLHFDTRQYAHIVWKNPPDLYEQLKNRIGATIGDGPLPKS